MKEKSILEMVGGEKYINPHYNIKVEKMTDKEIAEEYAKNAVEGYLNEVDVYHVQQEIGQAFLAGLKAGRPQWHDLRKDPNDLPPKMVSNHNFSIEVLSDRGEIVCYNFHYCEWFYWRSGEPIAWCEIPTFDVARCELVIKKGNW